MCISPSCTCAIHNDHFLLTWNHCTTIGAGRALSLRFFASFAAKTSHPPKLRHSQKRKQPSSPKSGAARCRTSGGGRAGERPSRRLGNAFGNGLEVGGRAARAPAKTQMSAPCSDELPWCQTPGAQEVVGGVRAGF